MQAPWQPPPLPGRAAAALAALAVLVLATTSGSLANSTDAIYAIVISDIVESGRWLAPEIAGGPYVMKPPFYFWFAALCVKALGPTAFAFRLPSILSGWLCVLLCAGITGRITRRHAGWYAGLAFAMLSPTWFEYTRRVFMEETLAAAMLAVLYGAIRAWDEDNPRWLWLVGPASAVALLTKSYGGGFAGVAILCWLPLAGRWRWMLSRPFLGGIALGAIPIVGYVALMLASHSEVFIHQNVLPFRIRGAGQFTWYTTGRWFYYTQPLTTDTLVYVGGLLGLGVGAFQAKRDRSLRGIWLLGLYVAWGYLVWDSLSAKRLYYLVPFLPALACCLAAFVVRALPAGITTTAVIAAAAGLVPLLQAPLFQPHKLDPEPAMAQLGAAVEPFLAEDALVFHYNDFFAAAELYFDRRAVGLTPSPEMLHDFSRILVLGERDIARDGRPAAMYQLVRDELAAGRPLHLVADEGSLARLLPGLPELKPWLRLRDLDDSTLWFASTQDPPHGFEGDAWSPELVPHPDGYGVALAWLLQHGTPDAAQALVVGAEQHHGRAFADSLLAAQGFTRPPVEPVEPPGSADPDDPLEPSEPVESAP